MKRSLRACAWRIAGAAVGLLLLTSVGRAQPQITEPMPVSAAQPAPPASSPAVSIQPAAPENSPEVMVWLKNGEIYRGVIVERVEDSHLVLKSSTGRWLQIPTGELLGQQTALSAGRRKLATIIFSDGRRATQDLLAFAPADLLVLRNGSGVTQEYHAGAWRRVLVPRPPGLSSRSRWIFGTVVGALFFGGGLAMTAIGGHEIDRVINGNHNPDGINSGSLWIGLSLPFVLAPGVILFGVGVSQAVSPYTAMK